jgi:hypothetical protein
VAVQEHRHGGSEVEAEENLLRVREHHHERPERADTDRAADALLTEVSPVNLVLLASTMNGTNESTIEGRVMPCPQAVRPVRAHAERCCGGTPSCAAMVPMGHVSA